MNKSDPSLAKLFEETGNLLTKFVIPLYEEDRKGRPSLHGTGFFVKSKNHHFLVSAGHVLETLKNRPLFYYSARNTLRKLAGQLILNPWTGDRDKDPIDVGIIKLSSESVPPYPDVEKFSMDITYLKPNRLPRKDKIYSIVGFPASKSGVNPEAKEVKVEAYSYRNHSIDDVDYASHNLDPAIHIAIPLNLKIGFDLEGKHRNFPKPQGMSGSPIWCLFDEAGINDARVFPVIAVGTKYRKAEKLLIGTDIAVVADMIKVATENS